MPPLSIAAGVSLLSGCLHWLPSAFSESWLENPAPSRGFDQVASSSFVILLVAAHCRSCAEDQSWAHGLSHHLWLQLDCTIGHNLQLQLASQCSSQSALGKPAFLTTRIHSAYLMLTAGPIPLSKIDSKLPKV